MTTSIMTAKERAVAIRAELKAAGFNARRVSVSVAHCGMTDDAITVRVRDASVDVPAVVTIARKYRQVDTCSITGEIQTGGNTFVKVLSVEGFIRG